LEPAAWASSGDFNEPLDHATGPGEALIQTATEDRAVQSSESDITHAVLDPRDKTKKLEERMETRISKVEEELGESRKEQATFE
jgi:hypothetical protein